ncbi:MAG: zinc-ribbon domain containing protein [Chloroflexi bacterium]|nr:zinc-ribbon domain containing protein [Chloroflexota bacterium]
MEDKSIRCSDCSTTFTFTTSEQNFYAEKGFTNEPKRCPACRRARKQQTQGSYQSRGA